MARYQSWEDYFWPDSDVLANKLNIRDQRMLSFVESQLSAIRIAEQVIENPPGAFDFARYCDVHRRIFQDVYDWAGEPRVVPEGAMTKRGPDVVHHLINDSSAPTVVYKYRPGPQVRDNAEYLFDRLQAEDALKGLPHTEFVRRLGLYWGALDQIHVHREGNTRTQTTFFSLLSRDAGYDLGAEQLHIRRNEFVAARFHGHATGDRYQRLTGLLASTVEPRDSLELTDRERRWVRGLERDAEQTADILRRRAQRDQSGPSLEL
ncbi:Fic/DOC family protein [Mycobacterium sp. SMC-17]|uniref:Fic/DOC family protein n=1 Tax=Mycobacterium sp. SMC-17 TaxID=3381628 RepID=UPI00387672AE